MVQGVDRAGRQVLAEIVREAAENAVPLFHCTTSTMACSLLGESAGPRRLGRISANGHFQRTLSW